MSKSDFEVIGVMFKISKLGMSLFDSNAFQKTIARSEWFFQKPEDSKPPPNSPLFHSTCFKHMLDYTFYGVAS